jgi:hypothetical protein
VAQQAAELYGRGKIIRFVTECLERPGTPVTPPLLLLLGPRGSGKTALLRRLGSQLGDGAPTAWLDFARDPDASPLTVLLEITRGFSLRVARVGVIQFPLLKVAFSALSLDPDDKATAAEQLERRLSGAEKQSTQVLRDMVQQSGKLLPPEQQSVLAETATVVSWLLSGISGRRRHKHLHWYAAMLGPGDGTELGPLLALHDLWRSDEPGDRRRVWTVLCSAMLADLRADFNDFSWRHGQRTTNCLLLLDNTDTAAGMSLLEALAECRRADPAQVDPLVVVAVQGTTPVPDLAVGVPIPATGEEMQHAAWLAAARRRDHPSPWCTVSLTDLAEDHVRALVKSAVFGKARRDAEFVHALTGGHPDATAGLARGLGLADGGFDPRGVLGLPADGEEPGHAGERSPTVEDHLFGRLRPDWASDVDVAAMAVCAATPGLSRVAAASVFRYLGWQDVDVRDVRDQLLELMWVGETAGDRLVIRPWPRLLLTRRLARDEALWQDTHNGYLSYFSGANDGAAVQYHKLALTTLPGPGNLAEVAGYLHAQLAPRRPAADWNALLVAITAAPARLCGPADGWRAADQRDVVKQLAGRREPGDSLRAVNRLAAARWLAADRLFDPARRLARLVADEYYELARLVEGDTEVFYAESDRFRRIAVDWEDRP